MNPSLHLWLAPVLPLAGFLLNGILGSRLRKWVVTAIGILAPLASFVVVLNAVSQTMLFGAKTCPNCGPVVHAVDFPYVETFSHPWISLGALHIDFSFVLDQLALVMLLVITGVGFLIHIYSVGYMGHEKGYARYFSFLNLFLFFMTVLVLAGNVLLMFVGWEGVGLASYLLIGFYFNKDSAASAGKKAFVVNRIGDFGFLIGIFLLLANFGTLTFSEIAAHLTTTNPINMVFLNGSISIGQGSNSLPSTAVLTAICLCLLIGAAGKSAQLPLYIWLPDAMEGPTPVSALIHAATMVTAGVYMIARFHVLFDHAPIALATVAVVGAATAIFAATIGLVQNDIKRVLAYSTISQLGYMFLACGVAAYSAAIFHLVTHAFFKALLFLAAGSVIHALGGEQDLRKMGGLWRKLPITFWTMTAAVLAIAGIYPFAGFFSKDAILYQAFIRGPEGQALWFVGLITALLTSIYMFRLWYLAFLGKPRTPDVHPHESPVSMLFPLVVLAALSLGGGWIGIERFSSFLAPSTGALPDPKTPVNPDLEAILSVAAVLVALLGWFIADLLYRRKPESPARLVTDIPGAYLAPRQQVLRRRILRRHNCPAVVRVLEILSGAGLSIQAFSAASHGSSLALANLGGTILQRWQSGNLRSYAAWLALGAAVLLIATLSFNSGWEISFHAVSSHFIFKAAGH